MTEFNLKIIKQKRLWLSILIIAVTLPLSFLFAVQFEFPLLTIGIPILILIILCTLLYLFSVGKLTITLHERQLNFDWKQKPIFNFKKHDSITVDDITEIIAVKGEFITQIKTPETVIELSFTKSGMLDSSKLLKLLVSETNIAPIDSWDVLKRSGWLTIAYRVNLFIIIAVIGIVITFIILKGFDSKLLLFIPLCLSQLIFAHYEMKHKL